MEAQVGRLQRAAGVSPARETGFFPLSLSRQDAGSTLPQFSSGKAGALSKVARPMISFIVPAHNEQAGLARTLQAIHDSARSIGCPYEVIVVNDASTDATPEIARQNNARVVDVNHRQIAATRNSGGKAALGKWLFFVDADTLINARAVAAALHKMEQGAVGGGGPTAFSRDEIVPLYIRLIALLQIVLAKAAGFTGGAFMFCTREAFKATGGFSERLFWAEEGSFALALKREGRFVVLWQPVLTSGRRFRTMSGLRLLGIALRGILAPARLMTNRAAVEKVWYDSNREQDDTMPDSLAVRLSNGIALILIIVMLTGPLWGFVPRSLTPLSSPLGKLRFCIGFFLCHVGLIFWPLAAVLFGNLLRQKRLAGSLQTMALIGFCAWQGWGAIRGVIWIWTAFGKWGLKLLH